MAVTATVPIVRNDRTPSKELLQRQLHKGLEAARQRWENCQED